MLGVAGFDEAYFLYFEDVDFCWRLGRAHPAMVIRMCASSPVVHAVGGSAHRRDDGTRRNGPPLIGSALGSIPVRGVVGDRFAGDSWPPAGQRMRAVIVHLGRDRALGERARVRTWRRLLMELEADVYELPLLTDARGPGNVGGVLRRSATFESLSWSPRKARRILDRIQPDVVVIVERRGPGTRPFKREPRCSTSSICSRGTPATAPRSRGACGPSRTGHSLDVISEWSRPTAGLHPDRRRLRRRRCLGCYLDPERVRGSGASSSAPVGRPPVLRHPVVPTRISRRSSDWIGSGQLCWRLAQPRRSPWPELTQRAASSTPPHRNQWTLQADFPDLGDLCGSAHVGVSPLEHTAGAEQGAGSRRLGAPTNRDTSHVGRPRQCVSRRSRRVR